MATILIADDDSEIRDFIKFLLIKEKHTVIEASNGKDALKKLLENRPAIVITDVMMPFIDGYHVTKTIQEDPQYAPVPKIIIITARDNPLDPKLSEIAGADAFISKPFKPEELLSTINELLKQ